MKLGQILEVVTKTLAGVKLGGKAGDPKLAALDRGILEVALMVAALDGVILPAEFAAFRELGRKCRGYSSEREREALDRALAHAGYLMAMAQVGVHTEDERIHAFAEKAAVALPAGFVDGSKSDVRRAFALWVAMGVSDGAFSDIERRAVEALAELFADLRTAKTAALMGGLGASTSGASAFCLTVAKLPRQALLEEGFLDRAERIVADLAVPERAAAAEVALAELVNA